VRRLLEAFVNRARELPRPPAEWSGNAHIEGNAIWAQGYPLSGIDAHGVDRQRLSASIPYSDGRYNTSHRNRIMVSAPGLKLRRCASQVPTRSRPLAAPPPPTPKPQGTGPPPVSWSQVVFVVGAVDNRRLSTVLSRACAYV